MTRETKIGMLVGLAFIIVIGILLCQQARNSIEPPPAPLPQVTDNVIRSVDTGARQVAAAVPVTPTPATPHEVIPTREDVTHPALPIKVAIGPGRVVPIRQNDTPASVVQQNDSNNAVAAANPTPAVPDAGQGSADQGGVPPDIQRVADQNGQQIVPIGPSGGTSQTPDHAQGAVTLASAKKYVAQPGDTVSRMAGRFMPGGNTNANRDAIVKVNPSLQKNKDIVIVGLTYIIPIPTATAAATPTPAPTPAPSLDPTPAPAAPASVEIWYTVKKGDTLSKIAADQLGDANAASAILELNRDKIKDQDTIYENMKLKLPAKPVASAQ